MSRFNFFVWLDRTTYALSDMRIWLITPLNSDNTSVVSYASTPLALFVISTIFIVLIMKVIHVFNPLS